MVRLRKILKEGQDIYLWFMVSTYLLKLWIIKFGRIWFGKIWLIVSKGVNYLPVIAGSRNTLDTGWKLVTALSALDAENKLIDILLCTFTFWRPAF